MAFDFRVKTTWRNSHKRKLLARRLGPEAVLAVYDLWSYCADARTDGDLTGLSDEAIAVAADYAGDASEWIGQLAGLGLLDGDELSRSVHDWQEHNPYVAEDSARRGKATANALARWHRDGRHTEPVDGCPICDKARHARWMQTHASSTAASINPHMRPDASSIASSIDPHMRSGATINAPEPQPQPDPHPDPEPQPEPQPQPALPLPVGGAAGSVKPISIGQARDWIRGQPIDVPGDLVSLAAQAGGQLACGLTGKARGLATQVLAPGPVDSWEYEEAIADLRGKPPSAGLIAAVILRRRQEAADASSGDAPPCRSQDLEAYVHREVPGWRPGVAGGGWLSEEEVARVAELKAEWAQMTGRDPQKG